MIIDTLQNAPKYFSVHPLFKQAFEYITSQNLAAIEVGKFDIGDGLKVITNIALGKTAEASVAKFECHNKNIDIQLCIKGFETMGWKPREKCVTPNGDYNEEKDVQLYLDQPDTYFNLTDHQFVIFFPEDVHAPMIGEDEIKKMVIVGGYDAYKSADLLQKNNIPVVVLGEPYQPSKVSCVNGNDIAAGEIAAEVLILKLLR